MDNSASRVGSEGVKLGVSVPHSPSKLKTYGVAIAIILGIGGLAVGAAGLAGYFHVGALSNMAQFDAIIMMAEGGGGGIILLIVGIANYKSDSTERAKIIRPDTQGGLVYGPEA
ncbi:MAG: hypothetical protein HY324_03795 [Chlamydiia bacterium]|nr:hypothetical protein [Chlamydiia bacterium]